MCVDGQSGSTVYTSIYLRDICPGPEFDNDKDEGYRDNNEEQYHGDPDLATLARVQCLRSATLTYSDASDTRLRHHSSSRNIANRYQIMICTER